MTFVRPILGVNDIAKRHPALVRAFERILYLGEQMAKLLRYSDGRGPKARDWHLNELSAVPERNSLNRCFYLHLTCLGCGELPCAVREIPESRFFPCASCQGEAEYRIMGEGGTLRALPFCERLVSDQYAAQILHTHFRSRLRRALEPGVRDYSQVVIA